MLRKESGSVYLMVVFAMAVIIVMMVMGVITINTNQIASSVVTDRQKYLADTQNTLNEWYRSHASDQRLWDPSLAFVGCTVGGVCDENNNAFLNEVGIQNKHRVRFFVSDVFQTYTGIPADPMSAEFHKNIVFRRIYFAIADPDTDLMSGIQFIPAESGLVDWADPASLSGMTPTFKIKPGFEKNIQFGYVDGKRIQEEHVARTYDVLLSQARLQESRFKAKIETDVFHDLGLNYFRAYDCLNRTSAEEMPCTEMVATTASWRTDPTGSMTEAIYLGFREVFDGGGYASNPATIFGTLRHTLGVGFPSSDSWGNPILIANSPAAGASLNPPFSMVVAAVTPWGTWLIVNAIQPVN